MTWHRPGIFLGRFFFPCLGAWLLSRFGSEYSPTLNRTFILTKTRSSNFVAYAIRPFCLGYLIGRCVVTRCADARIRVGKTTGTGRKVARCLSPRAVLA